MDKQNILKHIERWLDIRQKNGYKNARIGFKGMEEIHIVFENTFTDEERETIYDEEFYDLFVVDKICTDCCYEWGCREEKNNRLKNKVVEVLETELIELKKELDVM
mgnify:CR=1 FL=1